MRRQILLQSFLLLASVEAASAQTVTQTSVINYFFMAVGGNESSVGVNQYGALNTVYAVQTANSLNSIVVDQRGIADVSTLQQKSENGLNNAYVNQWAFDTNSSITQIGRTNIAGVAQNSYVGQAPSGPPVVLGGAPLSNGPLYQTFKTQDGDYLSLFETGSMSLATITSGGQTVTSGFGPWH